MRINSYRMALILTVRSKGTHHVKLRQGRQVWLSKPLATLGKDFNSSFEESSFFLAANLFSGEQLLFSCYLIRKGA